MLFVWDPPEKFYDELLQPPRGNDVKRFCDECSSKISYILYASPRRCANVWKKRTSAGQKKAIGIVVVKLVAHTMVAIMSEGFCFRFLYSNRLKKHRFGGGCIAQAI